MYDTLVNRMMRLGEEQPDKLAVAFKKESLNYGQLAAFMRNGAERLKKEKVGRGDRVLLLAVSKPEMVAAYLAIQYIGAVAVFVDKNATPQNIAFMYQDTEAVLLLSDKPMKEYTDSCSICSLRELYQECAGKEATAQIAYEMPQESDLAEIIYTSGTTGRPKGAMLSYGAVYHILNNTINGIGMLEDDRILLPLPLNHSFALRVLRAALYNKATVILQNGFTFAREIENNIEAYHCTGLAVVPASVETIRKQMQGQFARILGQLRYIEASAGSLSLEQKQRLAKELPATLIYNTWGSSESGGAIFLNVSQTAKDAGKLRSIGRPICGVEVKVLDEDGQAIISDRQHPGRMALKGSMQMSGYWNRPQETQAALQNGWLITSDMVYVEDGYIHMLGRADDIINVGGEKVSPIEVENVAGQYDGISDCACIGVPDADGIVGYVPVLFVVPLNHYSEKDLAVFLTGKLEKYKIPMRYVQVPEIPRTAMKKIDRKALRELWEAPECSRIFNPVIQALLTRRSIRRFQDKPIPKNLLEMIVRTGYYAPSGHNMQTWRFTVVTAPARIAALKEAASMAAKKNNVYFYGFENPSVLILVTNDVRNKYGCQDASAAAENMMLAAHSYGIGSVWLNPLMTLRNEEPVKSLLDEMEIPEHHTVWCMLALGYPLAEGTLLAKNDKVVRWL